MLLRLLTVVLLSKLCEAFISVSLKHASGKASLQRGGERERTAFILLVKRPKVADASDDWPTDLPSWALKEWKAQEPSSTSEASAMPPNMPTTYSVTNDCRTWELVLAKAVPEGALVSPASAMLAPKGGCDNLCDEEERYTDTCGFSISKGDAEWLLVRTEEKQWSFRIM